MKTFNVRSEIIKMAASLQSQGGQADSTKNYSARTLVKVHYDLSLDKNSYFFPQRKIKIRKSPTSVGN